jgi:hypothetical protein
VTLDTVPESVRVASVHEGNRSQRDGNCPEESSPPIDHGLEALELWRRAEPHDQSFARQPGGRAVNSILASQHLCFRYRVHGAAIGKRSMQSHEVDSGLTRVPVDHAGIREIISEREVRREEDSSQLGKGARLKSPYPLCRGQRQTRIGKAPWPTQRKSSRFCFALEHGVHRPIARSNREAPGGDLRMRLKWQLDHVESAPDKNCVSLLVDVAKRADEVVPVQHRSRGIHTHFRCWCGVCRRHARCHPYHEVTQLGDLAFGSTLNRIHIPLWPCPGTPQKIRKLPVAGAVKLMMSVPP